MSQQSNANRESESFSRREWLFLICILLMVEYWIFNSAKEFSGSQEVLNYVSFAGTVASILLAIIAIVYSFYQNDAQQVMTGVMAKELENLRGVAEDLASSNSVFKQQLARADRINDKLEVLDQGLNASRGQLADIQGEVSKLTAERAEKAIAVKATPTSPTSNAEISEDVVRRVLRQSTFEADVLTYGLHKYAALPGDVKPGYFEFLKMFFAEPVVKATAESHKRSITSVGAIDMGFQILMILRALGLIKLSEDEARTINLSPLLVQMLPDFVAEIERSENAFLKLAVNEINQLDQPN